MISRIYWNNKMGFPILSMIFVVSTLLVTIPSYLNPIWYEVFGGTPDPNYPWQLLTHHLQHGQPYPTELPTLLHLAGNLLVILTCGVLAEKLLGTVRFFLLNLSVIILSLLLPLFNMHGNGASLIAWSYSAVACYALIVCYRRNKRALLTDPLFYLFCFVLIVIWVVITLISYSWGWHITNLLHLTGTIIGAIATYLWRQEIIASLSQGHEHTGETRSRGARQVIALAGIIPVFLLTILLLASTGVISRHQPVPITTNITPVSGSSWQELNAAGGHVLIRFDEDMDMSVGSLLTSISWEEEPLKVELRWLNPRTLRVTFNRELTINDKATIEMKKFKNAAGERVRGLIHLEYGDPKSTDQSS